MSVKRVQISRAQAIKRAQAIVRKYVPEGVSLADELIAERRLEAKREAQRDAPIGKRTRLALP